MKTELTVKKFMLKKFPTNEYMDCPVPRHHWETIQEYAEAYASQLKPEMPTEYILCAANYYNDGEKYESQPSGIPTTGFVICGRRHHDCIFIFAKMYGFPYSEKAQRIQNTEKQGFLTNTNRFVTRLQALDIAKNANQIITGEGNRSLGLFSEDLY